MPKTPINPEGKKSSSERVKESRKKEVIEDYYSKTIDSIGGMDRLKDIFQDIEKFSKRLLGIDLYDYQKEILKNPSNKICINAGRRVGKTTVASIMGLHFALTHENVNVVIVSPTQRQSDILMSYIKRMVTSSILISMLVEKDIAQEVWFKNGSKIISLPSGVDGRTIRGITSHMIIFDEAAFMPDIIFDVVLPSIIGSSEHKIILISTPNMEMGYFYEATKNWKSYYHIKTEECPNIDKEFLEEERKRLDPYTFAREYEAKFISAEDSFFPLPLISRAFSEDISESAGYAEYTMGVDIGRNGSKCCLILMGYEDNTFYGKKMIYDTNYSISDFGNEIKIIANKYNPRFINIDTTGLGNALYEFLAADGVKNVKSVVFTTQVKNKMLANLRNCLEFDYIKVPYKWHKLREQLMSIKISTDPLKTPKTREQDAVIALGLAVLIENKRTVNKIMIR